MLIKVVEEIIYGKEQGIVIKVGIRRLGEGRRDFAVVYVSPKM